MDLQEYKIGSIGTREVPRMRGQYTNGFDESIQAMLLQHEIVSLIEQFLNRLIWLNNTPLSRVRSDGSICQVFDILVLCLSVRCFSCKCIFTWILLVFRLDGGLLFLTATVQKRLLFVEEL